MTKVSRTTICTLSVLAAVLGLLADLTPAAAMGACREAVTASGRAANGANYDPPRHYNTEKLAIDRAVAAWRTQVANKCPRSSNIWWRARERNVSCEGYAGGIGCEVRGVPARRIFN